MDKSQEKKTCSARLPQSNSSNDIMESGVCFVNLFSFKKTSNCETEVSQENKALDKHRDKTKRRQIRQERFKYFKFQL